MRLRLSVALLCAFIPLFTQGQKKKAAKPEVKTSAAAPVTPAAQKLYVLSGTADNFQTLMGVLQNSRAEAWQVATLQQWIVSQLDQQEHAKAVPAAVTPVPDASTDSTAKKERP